MFDRIYSSNNFKKLTYQELIKKRVPGKNFFVTYYFMKKIG